MDHPYQVLEPEYAHRLSVLHDTRTHQINARATELVKPHYLDPFRPVNEELGIPLVWMVCSFERECDCDFTRSPAQGDRWDRRSSNIPISGPFGSFHEAAIWSYRHDGIDKNSAPWTMPYCCWGWEKFNGFGPRDHGRVSGYNFAGTDQYDPPEGQGGKYVSDGRWSSSTVDSQLGCVPLALKMIELEPSLALAPHTIPDIETPPVVIPVPVGVGGDPGGRRDTNWIQASLNRLQVPGTPLLVDGNYGRRTRNAVRAFQQRVGLDTDGLCGPLTFAALEKALAEHP